MKKIIIVLVILNLLSFVTHCFGDELMVPFSCYPKEVQAALAKRGLKLDLDPINRTEDSWGFLKSEAQKYYIYTYESVTDEELTIMLKVAMEVESGKNSSIDSDNESKKAE